VIDIQAIAVKAAGCEFVPWFSSMTEDLESDGFCGTHDEDGNPPWDRCRWTEVLPMLKMLRADVLDDVSDEIKRLGSWEFGGLHYIQNSAVYGAINEVRQR